ncbi:aminoglycoside phosphotransferase family protein [Streptomyces pathocidini]|uniref:Aminoglycoside phosphotransferase family protein n=1 Tax=Streptomyces pathocidini TaxID=1650571 RepID=A0ABW7UZX4_9ACTN|nr:aminoglycoside phosphotransferase family protein [Streptomyces pathocidini]
MGNNPLQESLDEALKRAALLRALDSIPTEKIHEIINSLPRAGTRKDIGEFSRQALGIDEPLTAQLIGGPGCKGRSGAPVFLIRNTSGRVVAVTKVFPNGMLEEFVRELSALERMKSLGFDFQVAGALGAGSIVDENLPEGVVVYELAPGSPFDDLMITAAKSSSPEARSESLQKLTEAVKAAGKQLARLHSLPAGSGGAPDDSRIESRRRAARQALEKIKQNRDILSKAGVDVDTLVNQFQNVIDQSVEKPGWGALTHGDTSPGNIFWDDQKGVTFIDFGSVYKSMDSNGNPAGFAEIDVAIFLQETKSASLKFGLTIEEAGTLTDSFLNSYQSTTETPIVLSEPLVRLLYVRPQFDGILKAINKLSEVDLDDLEEVRGTWSDEPNGIRVSEIHATLDTLKQSLDIRLQTRGKTSDPYADIEIEDSLDRMGDVSETEVAEALGDSSRQEIAKLVKQLQETGDTRERERLSEAIDEQRNKVVELERRASEETEGKRQEDAEETIREIEAV